MNNEQQVYLENMQENFEQALARGDRNLAKSIVEDLKWRGFDTKEFESKLEDEMEKVYG